MGRALSSVCAGRRCVQAGRRGCTRDGESFQRLPKARRGLYDHFPLSLVERGVGGEGRDAAALMQARTVQTRQHRARIFAPHRPPLLRKGEGGSVRCFLAAVLAFPERDFMAGILGGFCRRAS